MAPLMDQNPDIERLRQEYSRRAENLKAKDLYSSENPAHNWMISDRQQNILGLVNSRLTGSLSNLQILEIGCGSGGVLKEFIQFGATPVQLTGVDLLFNRLERAAADLPECSWVNANGQYLPLKDQSFDLLLQFTAFSSILDPGTKREMAADMLRVLKPGASILWYDFIWNPTNKQTKGIGLNEIKTLFPFCKLFPLRITLIPPLTRLLLPSFPRLVNRLSSLKVFNSHLLVWIQKSD